MTTLPSIRNNFLLLVVSLYLILNYGFMQLRIPPTIGSGVPIGELVILITFFTINHFKLFNRLSSAVTLFPFIVWWAFGIGSALLAVPSHGMWALRDASHVIESLFLPLGFAFAARPKTVEQFFKILPVILVCACVYALLYPYGPYLRSISPKILGGAGYSTPILFNFQTTAILLLTASSYLMIFKLDRNKFGLFIYFLAIFFIGYAVVLFQARIIYLQVISLIAFLFIFRKDLFAKGLLGIMILLGVIASFSVLDLQIKGRLGQVMNLDFLINHFTAIFGVTSKGVEGAAGGVWQRLEWWAQIYKNLLVSPGAFIFGLGFGKPLTEFYYIGGMIVREPHNSFVSVCARMGLIGAVSFLWMHYLLIKTWYRTYMLCHRNKWKEWENRLLIMMVYFILIWVFSMGEDGMEKPYNAIPYYFFWGITLRFAKQLHEGLINPGAHPDAYPSRS